MGQDAARQVLAFSTGRGTATARDPGVPVQDLIAGDPSGRAESGAEEFRRFSRAHAGL